MKYLLVVLSACLLRIGSGLASDLPFVDLTHPADVLVDGVSASEGVVEISADGAVRVRSARPLSWVELRWKTAFPDDALSFGGEFERTYGDNGWFPVGDAKRPRKGAMPWYVLVSDGSRTDGYGVMTQPSVFAAWHAEPGALRLVLDCRAGSRPVKLGARVLEACRLVSRKGYDGERAFAAGRAFCRVMCPNPRLPDGPVYGYNDWYCAYGINTATNFLADAAFAVSLVKDEKVRPYVVIDDGWQIGHPHDVPVAHGERWAKINARWGMEMDEVARRIKALGAHPGLWFRPFLPDCGEKSGMPIDPTDPEVERVMRADLKRFADWGYEMVKIDFITFDWCGTWGFEFGDSPVVRELPAWRDETRTTAEVVRGLYAAMRDAVGDRAIIIGCNAIDHFAAGLFELQRTGDDTSGTEWSRTRKMGPNTLGMRAIHNDTFYRVDGDCFGLAAAGKIPEDLNTRWLDLLANSGSAFFISWKRQLTTPEMRAKLLSALQRAARRQPTLEPLDWMRNLRPESWSSDGRVLNFTWPECVK